jgi:hypothetical protein
MWDLQNGNETAARDNLLATVALARNVAQSQTLISLLVDIAIENIVWNSVAENFNHFSPATLRQLADGFAALPAPASFATSLAAERDFQYQWLLTKVDELRTSHPANDAAVMAGLQPLMSNTSATNFWFQLTNASGGTSDGLIRLIHDTQPLYDRLIQIISLPPEQANRQLNLFTNEIQKTGNYLLLQYLPGVQAVRRKELLTGVDSAMVQAAIQFKLHGEDGFKQVKDPGGEGPFKMERFVFDGEDRGFQLESKILRGKQPDKYIFVEKDGPPFVVMGNHVGLAPAP